LKNDFKVSGDAADVLETLARVDINFGTGLKKVL
jgi:hypothetical protein